MFLLIFLIKIYIFNIFDFLLPQQFGMKHQREKEYRAKPNYAFNLPPS